MTQKSLPNDQQRHAICELLAAAFVYMRTATEAECHALAYVLHNVPLQVDGLKTLNFDGLGANLRRFQQEFYQSPNWGPDFAEMLERNLHGDEPSCSEANVKQVAALTAIGSLDDLLNDDEPHATFHDARMVCVRVDYEAQTFAADFELCVGDPSVRDESRERRRRGSLVVDGLVFWSIEPPGHGAHDTAPGYWLTAEGRLDDCSTETGRALAERLSPGETGWYLYFSDLNASGYLAGRSAEFVWYPL